MFRALLFVGLVMAAPAAVAEPLTVRTGETWAFGLLRGQPVQAHRAKPGARPRAGQIVVSVSAMLGTIMTISGNRPQPYTYKAELVAGDKVMAARSCTLPANGAVSFEHWPQQASAVRLSDFRVAARDGSCP